MHEHISNQSRAEAVLAYGPVRSGPIDRRPDGQTQSHVKSHVIGSGVFLHNYRSRSQLLKSESLVPLVHLAPLAATTVAPIEAPATTGAAADPPGNLAAWLAGWPFASESADLFFTFFKLPEFKLSSGG